MSLIEDIQKHYEHEKYPPDGPDLDYDYVDGQWVKRNDEVATERVSHKVIDDTPRWGDVIQVVYKRGDKYVAVEDVAPGTEYQSWGDYGDPEIYECRPVEVTVTQYRKV